MPEHDPTPQGVDAPPQDPVAARGWRPHLEQLEAFLVRHCRRAGELEPGPGDRFVREFLDGYGPELVDELFGPYLDGLGERYRRKLVAFARAKGVVHDEPRAATALRSDHVTGKPPKLVAPPHDAGAKEGDRRAVS